MPGYVGVAPGTTTIFIRPDGSLGSSFGAPCGLDNVWPYITPPNVVYPGTPGIPPTPTTPAGSSRFWFNPYGTEAALKGTTTTDNPIIKWILLIGLVAITGKVTHSYLLSRKTSK